MKVSELFEGVDKRPQSMIPMGVKIAAEQLRKKGLKVRVDTRVIGRPAERSNRTVMTVNGDIEEADILKVLKKNKVDYATVGSQMKDGVRSRMIRLITPNLRPTDVREGWKMGTAAAVLSAAVVAGIANSPKVEINGETYDKAGSLRSAPADAKSATVTINGKKTKVLYWTAMGTKHNRKNRVYAPAE